MEQLAFERLKSSPTTHRMQISCRDGVATQVCLTPGPVLFLPRHTFVLCTGGVFKKGKGVTWNFSEKKAESMPVYQTWKAAVGHDMGCQFKFLVRKQSPTFLAPVTSFVEIFLWTVGKGRGGGSGGWGGIIRIIQVLYIYCVLYFYYYYINSTTDYHVLDPRGWGPMFYDQDCRIWSPNPLSESAF